MQIKNITRGIVLILIGIGLFAYYDQRIKPESEAQKLLRQAQIMSERDDKKTLNKSFEIFTKIIADYPGTKSAIESYFSIGMLYEKLGFYRLANIKYSYILKSKSYLLDEEIERKTITRMAHLKILKNYSDEGVNKLLEVLNNTNNRESRSRIYSELGFTLLKANNYKKALHFFVLAIREDGNNEEALLGKARALKKKGSDMLAFNEYDKFLQQFGSVSTYTVDVKNSYQKQAYLSGLKFYRLKKYKKAIKVLKRVLKNFNSEKISENTLYWIGESYFSTKEYKKSINYFSKTLNNNYYHKDEDARLKKGYSYFMLRNYKLAAKEFDIYNHFYKNGKYAHVASKWKDICVKEMQYINRNKNINDNAEENTQYDNQEFDYDDDKTENITKSQTYQDNLKIVKEKENLKLDNNIVFDNDEVSGVEDTNNKKYNIKLDNLAEI